MKTLKNYNNFLNEEKHFNLDVDDIEQLSDFLIYVKDNLENDPYVLRAAYDRIFNILNLLKNSDTQNLTNILHIIYNFIEGGLKKDELRRWSEKLYSILPEEYNKLKSIINLYNHIVNKNKDKFGKIDDQTIPNIKSWIFEEEGVQEVRENNTIENSKLHKIIDESIDDIKKLILTNEEVRREIDEDGWYIGSGIGFIAPNDEEYRIKIEVSNKKTIDILDQKYEKFLDESKDYEKYCDFGSNYISKYLENNPDINVDDFSEFVSINNRADRDMGELQDVSKEEIERLGKEYKKQKK